MADRIILVCAAGETSTNICGIRAGGESNCPSVAGVRTVTESEMVCRPQGWHTISLLDAFGMRFGVSAHPEDNGTVLRMVKTADERLILSKQNNKIGLTLVVEDVKV